MRMVDLIHKKRSGGRLSEEDIRTMVSAYVSGEIPDYQMSAMAMAICFQGMDDGETSELTLAMAESGQHLDWADIPGPKVDKHSTGGVGDTTTLVLAPLVAAAGAPVVKMSGRGLGHTGGTVDKLESIPGFRTSLPTDAFKSQVKSIGVAIAAQTADLAPADKKLYGLRDVTGTVESLPLIASSIMSKKLASGADAIVLDVKVGDGAFMKGLEEARRLAETMVRIGDATQRKVIAVMSRMDEPLGQAIGNALEVCEAIRTLRGEGPADLTELCLTLGSHMLVLAGKAEEASLARATLEGLIQSGAAIQKFREFVAAQGGNPHVADDPTLLPQAPVVARLVARESGVVQALHAEALGLVAMRLGAGRAKADDVINPAVGLVLQRKVGEAVRAGDVLMEIHAPSEAAAEMAMAELTSCISVGDGPASVPPLILDVVGREKDRQRTAERKSLQLVFAAVEARAQSYSPYSRFAVGAAIRLDDGRIVTGVNVENASYGLTSCAERNAVFHAISAGYLKEGVHIAEVAVAADSPEPVAPCGACRQVLSEFCKPETPVYLANLQRKVSTTSIQGLLPYAFSSAQME